MKAVDRVYLLAPTLLQHAAVSAFGWRWKRRRFGGVFAAERDGFVAREKLDAAGFHRFQTDRLRALLCDALTHVPYYRREWRGLLTLEQARRFELADLHSLPILEKDRVRAAPEDFLRDDVDPKTAVICPTSGSTGTPVRTYWTDADFQRSLALREARACRPAGVSYSSPRATFSGRLVVPAEATRPPFYRFNVFERQVYFSAFHLSPKNAAAYVDGLRRHGVVWGTGYSHAWSQLAKMMLEQGISAPPSMRAVITTSEPLPEEDRKAIEQAFGCRAYAEYGQVEDACWACEDGERKLRLSPDASVLEVLRPDGSACEPGEAGEAVATSFIRICQPLIRYRVGDVVTLSREVDAGLPVLQEVVGRLEDVVIGPDGRRTVRFHGIFTELKGCREAQVVQEASDRLRIKVVPAADYSQATADEIVERIGLRFGRQMRVVVEPVTAIPRSAAGKFQAVVRLGAAGGPR